MKKNVINYFRVYGKNKDEKLSWLSSIKSNNFKDIPFEHISPDKNNNWINLTDNDWDSLVPLIESNINTIFNKSTIGVNTARDEWVFDFNSENLSKKVDYFLSKYKEFLMLSNKDVFQNVTIKWSDQLKRNYIQNKYNDFSKDYIINVLYRPFINIKYYSDKLLSDRLTDSQFITFGNNLRFQNFVVCLTNSDRLEFGLIAVNILPTFQFYMDPAKFLPLYVFSENGDRFDNITDWGLQQFHSNYNDTKISKEDIFHYVYGVLHNPEYREKYELNLKREFPRIPFYDDFWKWAKWGEKLMDLHINFETVKPTQLRITNYELRNEPYKVKLKSNKDTGEIYLDNITTISGIPKEAWEYKLGNRSGLEWILDQYKEKKPKDPTIAKMFNTYKFIDYKDKVIDLIMRVTTVSVETIKIIKEMEGNG